MGYLGNQITTVFPTSISVDSATISGNASVGGTLGVTGVSTLSDNIVFDASGKGVHLGVTSATNSNLIHDYEEGTWTPTWVGASGSPTYHSQVGRYTKVGNRVHATGYLYITNKNTLSGNIRMGGLPFTSSNISTYYHPASIWVNTTTNGQNMDGDYFLEAFVDTNSSECFIYSLDGDGGVAQINVDKITNTTDIMINLTYQTEA